MGGTLSALAPWVRVAIGGLSSGLCWFAAWIAFIWWLKHHKIFHALTSGLFAIAGIIFIFSTYYFQHGWIGALLMCIAIGSAVYFLGKWQDSLREFLIAGMAMTLIVSISIPLLLVWSTQQQLYVNLNTSLTTALSQLGTHEHSLANTATSLSTNSSIVSALSNGLNAENQADMSRLLVVNQLNQLTITNTAGIVIERAQDSTRNDNFLTLYPWFINALQGDTLNGTAISRYGEPSIVAMTPIMKNGALIGGLLIGQAIRQVLSTTNLSSFAIVTHQGVTSFTSQSPSEVTIFHSAGLASALSPYTAGTVSDGTTFQFRISTNGDHFRVVGTSTSTLTSNQPVSFLTLDPDQNNHPQPLTLALLSLLAGVIVSGGSLLVYRKYYHG